MAFNMGKIDLRQKPSAREAIVFVFLLLFLFWFLLHTFLSPQMKELKKSEQQLHAAEQESKSVAELIQAISKQLAEHQSMPDLEPAIEQKFDERLKRILTYRGGDRSQEMSQTVGFLSSPQTLRGLKLLSIDVKGVEERKGYTVTSIDVRLEGAYISLIRYMKLLEATERPIFLAMVELTGNKKSNMLQAQFVVEMFLSKE